MFLNDDVTAGRPQLNFLRFRRLFVRRHARVTDLPALWSTRASILRFTGHLRRLSASERGVCTNTEDISKRSFVNVFSGPPNGSYGFDEPENQRFEAF